MERFLKQFFYVPKKGIGLLPKCFQAIIFTISLVYPDVQQTPDNSVPIANGTVGEVKEKVNSYQHN